VILRAPPSPLPITHGYNACTCSCYNSFFSDERADECANELEPERGSDGEPELESKRVSQLEPERVYVWTDAVWPDVWADVLVADDGWSERVSDGVSERVAKLVSQCEPEHVESERESDEPESDAGWRYVFAEHDPDVVAVSGAHERVADRVAELVVECSPDELVADLYAKCDRDPGFCVRR
jgi:hypothetical protein